MNIQQLRPLFFILSLLLSFGAKAQCLYTLEMLDAYGDGWNGGALTITTGGVPTTYTLDNTNDDGIDSTLTFAVSDGAPFVVSYATGAFPWEVSFKILDNTGGLFLEGNAPATGVLYSGIGDCITCAKPTNFFVENVWDNRVKLRWQANYASPNPVLNWRVIYGPQGFDPALGQGDTADVSIPNATLQGRPKKTWYDAYVSQYCDTTGGYSDLVGPVSFQTYWTNDVGIADVIAPVSGCDLGADSIKIILKNYGAAPQSLVPFTYSVNGVEAHVVQPADGFYTGVLGKDSSVVFAFETLPDFSTPGEYRIDVYSIMTTDEDVSNDTFTYYITNRLQPTYVQNFEEWSGGWTVGTDSQNPSWEFGKPNKPAIPNAASGENAWVTSLAGTYNPSEHSYLESPCFDFSNITADPVFEFSLNRNLESTYDGVWLEMSLNGGQSWTKVGAIGEGLNWYTEDNQNLDLQDVWSGSSNGWITGRHSLPNSAGQSEVHLRFVMASDGFAQYGGFGVDDVRIYVPFAKDLAGLSISTLGENDECGLETDQVSFTFSNFGNQTQNNIQAAYSINGATPIINTVPGNLAPDQSITHTFNIPFDSRDEAFEIKCWAILGGDQAASNDTAYYTINHKPKPVPFQQNFEALTAPPTDWTYTPSFGFNVTNQHNNISKVLAFNLYSGNPEFTETLPRYGLIAQGDSLRFTYRITDYASQGQTPTTLQAGSKIEVQASVDCGTNYQTIYTIGSFNHIPSVSMRTIKINLSQFAGKAVKFRFKGTWGAGDFWFDLDNINLLACAADMGLTADVVPNTPGLSDGEATVNVALGTPPYSFEWSNGATGETATGLIAGTYTVTVTDAFGCSAALTIILGSSAVNTPEDFAVLSLRPNPTHGIATLYASFDRAMDAQIEVLNPQGQRIWSNIASDTDRLKETFDLSNQPAGLYLIRLTAEGKVMTRKLVKE